MHFLCCDRNDVIETISEALKGVCMLTVNADLSFKSMIQFIYIKRLKQTGYMLTFKIIKT